MLKKIRKLQISKPLKKLSRCPKLEHLFYAPQTVAREEIEKIPEPFRNKHVEIYQTLNILKGSVNTWIDDDPLSTGYRRSIKDADFVTLQGILPHEDDARHLFQAKKAGVSDIITADYKSMLNKRNELESQCGLKVFSPSDYFESLSN